MRGTAIFCWPSNVVLDRHWGRFRVTLGVDIDGRREGQGKFSRARVATEEVTGPRLDLYLL
jgi:hypothetical protein